MAMMSTGNRFQSSQSPPQFNNSSNRGKGRNSNGRGRGGRGYSHNGRGGFQNQNNYSSTNSGNTGNQSQSPYYQIFGKVGHLALDCYHRMDYSYQGRHPLAKLVALASGNNLHSTSNQPPSGSSWPTQTTPSWMHHTQPSWQLGVGKKP